MSIPHPFLLFCDNSSYSASTLFLSRLHLVVSSRRLHCVLLQYPLRKQQEDAAEVVVTLILPVGRRILPLMIVVTLSSRLSRLKYLNPSEFMRKRLSLMRPPTPTVLPTMNLKTIGMYLTKLLIQSYRIFTLRAKLLMRKKTWPNSHYQVNEMLF